VANATIEVKVNVRTADTALVGNIQQHKTLVTEEVVIATSVCTPGMYNAALEKSTMETSLL
tara:strand:- start:709 stop:891 length:183 start_codon:yes stop_codon:yes gene_type:complete